MPQQCNIHNRNILLHILNLMFLRLILIFTILIAEACAVSIQQFGARPYLKGIDQQNINSIAIAKAFEFASRAVNKQVLIPNRTYYSVPILIQSISNVRLINQGKLVASTNIERWPKTNRKYNNFIQFDNCSNITVEGGSYDGKGFKWWRLTLYDPHKLLKSDRPHLVQFNRCSFCFISNVHLINSPQYTLHILDSRDMKVGNIKISVNTTKQYNLIKEFKALDKLGPQMFPFNTDGVNVQGINMHIYNITNQNYNDIVVIKPATLNNFYSFCTENILVENVTSKMGSGLSIGSVRPSQSIDCIRNITFRNAVLKHPYKGIYIKTYSSQQGSSIIEKILYENIKIINTIYWSIYIGPHKDGPGCLNVSKCTPEPRVSIKDIKFKNISIINPTLFPFMILCSSMNPCTNFVFENVNTNKWVYGGKQNRCLNAEITSMNSSPALNCIKA